MPAPQLTGVRIATIANGATTSGAVDLGGYAVIALYMPVAFTGTSVTFTASPTLDGTYHPVYADATQVSVTVAASRTVALVGDEATALAACRFIKIVSGSAEGAARSISLLCKA